MNSASGDCYSCFTYVFRDALPESLPSKPYLDVLITGAKEHDLPRDYTDVLRNLSHNGYTGDVNPP